MVSVAFPPQNVVGDWEGYYKSETGLGKNTHCGSSACCVWGTAVSPRDAHSGGTLSFMAGMGEGGEIWGNPCTCCGKKIYCKIFFF